MAKILLAGRVRCSEGIKKTAGKTLLGKPGGLTLNSNQERVCSKGTNNEPDIPRSDRCQHRSPERA